ncbi:hypothetical protein [Aestuariivirga sp.]|uniref:hypothetical protein n=1 Tax=Aestuariivirga sp. TaxID=2650926 RepID=UPI0039E28F7B
MTPQKQFDVNMAAAETIARRLPMMWWAMMSPSPQRSAEMLRMVAEKQQAFLEGVWAMQLQMGQEMLRFWSGQSMARSAERVSEAAAAPAVTRVLANRRRLRARKRI